MDTLDIILQTTYTSSDLRHKMIVLREHLERMVFGQKENEELNPSDSQWLASLGENFYKQFTKDNLYSSLKDLEKKVAALTPLIIYLSFEPGFVEISKIGAWIRKNFTTKFILHIKLDPELLGGAAFVYKGVYKDYSLREKISSQGETIITEFKKFIT